MTFSHLYVMGLDKELLFNHLTEAIKVFLSIASRWFWRWKNLNGGSLCVFDSKSFLQNTSFFWSFSKKFMIYERFSIMFFMSPLFHFIGFLYHTYLCHKETFSNEAHYSHNLLEFSKCMKCVPEHEKYLIYKVVGGFFIPPANLYLYTYFMHVLKPIKLFFFLSFYYRTKIFISSDCDGKKFMKRNLLGKC